MPGLNKVVAVIKKLSYPSRLCELEVSFCFVTANKYFGLADYIKQTSHIMLVYVQ